MALTDQTLDLEDIQTNSTSHTRRFESSIKPRGDKFYSSTLEALEWYWKLWILPWAYRISSVLLGILSVIIVWCEVTFGIYINSRIRLSIFAALIYVLHDYSNYIAVEGISIGIIAYLSICAYFTVFRIRIFNLYNIAPHHSTDEYSLLFSAMLFTRLALPICLNYLYMIQVVELQQHEDNMTPKTAFAYATGNTNLIPWLTNYFYIYYPIVILLVCVLTIFSVGTRLASLLGYQKFIGEDDFSVDFIEEGKTLMKRERRLRERSIREHGRKSDREQLPFELLREASVASGRRGIDRFAQRRAGRESASSRQTQLHEEDETRVGRFVGRMKGLASKGKDVISSKYQSSKEAFAKRRGKDDAIELLAAGKSSSSSVMSVMSEGASGGGHTYRGTSTREPPKDIFDDI